jgi:hypothetical protein
MRIGSIPRYVRTMFFYQTLRIMIFEFSLWKLEFKHQVPFLLSMVGIQNFVMSNVEVVRDKQFFLYILDKHIIESL